MNIALPAVMIILGLLPGIVFFESYFSGRFPKQAAAISPVAELALYVLFAVPLDAIALAVTHRFGSDLDFDLVAGVLFGTDPTGALREAVATSLRDHWQLTALTYGLVLLGAFLSGNFLRRFVWACRIDVYFPPLRMKHQWFYVLQGRLPALPRSVVTTVDVLIEHPQATQLYRGTVSSFQVDRDGGIGQLILRDTFKDTGKDGKDAAGNPVPAADRWKAIEGDKFIVMGPSIRSVNLKYYKPNVVVTPPPKPKSLLNRLDAVSLRLWRSFWFEEP